MAGIEDDLTSKVGPFPVWGWGIVLGGVAVGYMFLHRGSGTTTATAVDPTVDPNAAMNADDAALAGSGTGDTGDVTNVSPVPTPAPSPDTNALWETRGILYMTGQGTSALTTQIALSRYLNKKALYPTGLAIVEKVVAHQGPPPEAGTTFKPVIAPKPKPVPTPGPGSGTGGTKTKTITVHAGQNTHEIVRRYWGSATAAHIAEFRSMNGLTASDHLIAGHHYKVKA